jgi:hypothetical protein
MTAIDYAPAEADEPLSAADDRALARVLGRGTSYSTAAELLGISKRTVTRRMADSAFRRVVEAETERRGEDVLRSLATASRSAVDLLRDVVEDSEQPIALRVTAAEKILAQHARREAARLPAERTADEAREHLRLLVLERMRRQQDDEDGSGGRQHNPSVSGEPGPAVRPTARQ